MSTPETKKSLKQRTRLSGFAVVESITFGGQELVSVTIGRNTDTIEPARLEPDGAAVVIDKGQRADGVLLRKKCTNLGTREEYLDQYFVPFANIRGFSFGE